MGHGWRWTWSQEISGRDSQMTPVFTFTFFPKVLAEHMAPPGRCYSVARSGQGDVSASIGEASHFPLDVYTRW